MLDVPKCEDFSQVREVKAAQKQWTLESTEQVYWNIESDLGSAHTLS